MPGERCWKEATATNSLSVLRHALGMLQVPGAAAFTWKSVRAGRATELARTPGVTVQQIMDAGDWKAQAVFNYIKQEEAEPMEVLALAIEDSEPESQ